VVSQLPGESEGCESEIKFGKQIKKNGGGLKRESSEAGIRSRAKGQIGE